MGFNGSYSLIDDNGNIITWKSRPNHLREAFDRAGLDAAWIAYSPEEKLLRVTKDTPNSVWNEFSRAHEYDGEGLGEYLAAYFEHFDSLEESKKDSESENA